MSILNRRDRIADPADTANNVLKPAIYDPPGSANQGGGTSARTTLPPVDAGSRTSPLPSTAPAKDTPESKLFVGVNIKLKGVEITDCDTLVVEGSVEATMDSRVIQISERGAFKGSAEIDVAEIRGLFEGNLTVRQKLVIYSTGKVTGKVRYGKVVIEEGGQLSGEIEAGAGPKAATATTPRAGLQPVQ
jgi:cytoskeletal protein CcmA (bactofilin family)